MHDVLGPIYGLADQILVYFWIRPDLDEITLQNSSKLETNFDGLLSSHWDKFKVLRFLKKSFPPE